MNAGVRPADVVDGNTPSGSRGPLGLVAACVLLWWLWVCSMRGDEIDRFVNFDALAYWVPLLREAAAQWRRGVPPLWNPYQALGTPLLATMQLGATYPLNVLYLVLNVGWAWLLTGAFHHLIGVSGMYAYCRTLRISKAAAAVGAATYGFSALVLGKYIDQPEWICLAWLPLLFACAERLLRAPSVPCVTCWGVVWALEILGGHPETIAQSALLQMAYVGWRVPGLARQGWRRALRGALASAAAVGLGAALTAFQWIPTFELVRGSVRAIGAITASQQVMLSAEWWYFATGPAGRVPLVLALIGAWVWRDRGSKWFFAGMAAILALLAVGPATPVFEIFRMLPTGTWLRAPVRFLNVWPLCIAVLAAGGASELLDARSRDAWRGLLPAVIGSAILVLVARLGLGWHTNLVRLCAVIAAFDVLPLGALGVAYVASCKPSGNVRWRQLGPAVGLCAACVLPGFYVRRYASPLQVTEMYGREADVFAGLRGAAPARVLSLLRFAGGARWAKLGTYFEVPVLNDLEPLSLADFRGFADALRGGGPDPTSLEGLLTIFMGDVTPLRGRFDARLLNLAGVRFVLADAQGEAEMRAWFEPEISLVPWRRSATAVVYENQTAMPRAFFVGAAGVRRAGSNCLDALHDVHFDPRHELLLEQPLAEQVEARDEVRSVRIISYAQTEVRLGITGGGKGVVVLTDAFYPGWSASVDGVPALVLRADCFFRAVPVSAGAHEITLRYAPWSFRIGSAIALVSAGAAVSALYGSLRRRRPPLLGAACLIDAPDGGRKRRR